MENMLTMTFPGKSILEKMPTTTSSESELMEEKISV